MRRAEGEQRSGFEKVETRKCWHVRPRDEQKHGTRENQRPGLTLRKGTRQREKEVRHRDRKRDTWNQAKKGDLVPRKLALPPCLLTCSRSLHPMPSHSRTTSRMRSCFGRQLREDGEQVWM